MAAEKETKPRTKAEIENDLAAVRSRLSANVASLIDEVHPQRVKERQIEGIKDFARDEAEHLKLQFVTGEGGLRTARLAAIGAAVAGLAGFVIILSLVGSRRARGRDS